MLRAGLAADTRARMDKRPIAMQAQELAIAQVQASSSAAAVATAVDEAVSGDLVERSPALAERLRNVENRLQNLE